MQNDIRLHLAKNEKQQTDIELAQAKSIQARFEKNVSAFSRYVPSIANSIKQKGAHKNSIFINKDSEINIVKLESGTSFYHFNVDSEIQQQAKALDCYSVLANFKHCQKAVNPIQNFDDFLRFKADNQKRLQALTPDTLIILGIGKGAHIAPVVSSTKAKNIVIYEPNWELFYCSLFCCEWHEILERCAVESIHLFLQIENDASSLHSDLKELSAEFTLENIVFFKHYNAPIFDYIMQQLRAGSSDVLFQPIPTLSEISFQNCLPPWSPSTKFDEWESVDATDLKFQKNFRAFEKYFPSIASKFDEYESSAWQVIKHKINGQINLFNVKNCALLSIAQCQEYGESIASHFRSYPNQDGLIFGYESPKLKHYLHNTFVRRASTVLRHQKDEKGELPKQVKSMILFGLEAGYSFEALLQSTNIDKLFICEPNPDFFYASLFAIDWDKILRDIDKNEKRIYLNIGEAGSALYADINNQFYAAGPHLLADTYFFQAYHNSSLSRVIKDLRDELRVTFAIGENLDHALYGISQTKYALQHKIPAMAANPSQYISKSSRQLPVFIVGNGPSLDECIETLKELRDNIIIVSCGTVLQALHSYKVVPDFHAEVEQCRATFDWASRINDADYLKQITLVSVNGIHPDTANIYKNTLFAFKQGESSSVSAKSVLGREKFAMLNKAYPTVTNLAVNFFLELGFVNLYLLGVDLGFVDYNKHHSSKSGYFENGKQVYDYQENLAKSLPVKGNFRDLVYTKAEFNISRSVMEQALSDFRADCYNLSDGVFIDGSSPLNADDVLISSETIDRVRLFDEIRSAFIIFDSDISKMYEERFDRRILNREIEKLKHICAQELTNKTSLVKLIDECRELLEENMLDGRSLFVHYFHGSLNNLCATLNKALMSQDEKQAIENAQSILGYWQRLVEDAELMLNQQGTLFDTSSSFSEKREAPHCITISANLLIANAQLRGYISEGKSDNLHIIDAMLNAASDLPTIVLLSNQDDILRFEAEFAQVMQASGAKFETCALMIVYTDAQLLSEINSKLVKYLPASACLAYMPLWLDYKHFEQAQSGRIPLIERDEALQFLIARLPDAEKFKHIIFRARFDETGLIRALDHKQDEYSSDAVNYLAENFSPLFTFKHAFSFNRYIALLESEDAQPTLLDTLENRGLLLPRDIQPYELLGEWYKTPEAEAIRSHIQEHAQSV